MSLNDILYHGLISCAIVLSLVAVFTGHKRYLPLTIVLMLTEAVEIFAYISSLYNHRFIWAYHVFNIFEYVAFSLYFYFALNNLWAKRLIIISIPIYIITCIFFSYWLYHFRGFPGLNLSLEGLLLSIYCAILFLNIEPNKDERFFKSPDIWISLGVIIFFGATFFYNGLYSRLLHFDEKKARDLFGVINKPLNLLMYSFICYGLICLIAKKK